jgi:hypothetical protein
VSAPLAADVEPLLVSRPAGDVTASILVALDAASDAMPAVRCAARIAGRHDSAVAILAAPRHDAPYRNALASAAALLRAASGSTPVILEEYGSEPRAVAAAATSLEASLVVVPAGRGA